MTLEKYNSLVKDFFMQRAKVFSYTTGDREMTDVWAGGSSHCYSEEWCIGGMSGGNCWGDSPSYSVDADEEPNFDLLDDFLEAVCPQMSFKQYKKMLSELVRYSERNEYEYYGNYTKYRKKTIKYQDIYDFLVREGIINN
jgi:hypothetical protein